jgi:CBS domain-containing protein
MTADEIMTSDVTTVDERATLGQALEIMQEKSIRHLPVVRGRELVGILSDRDLRSFGVTMVADVDLLDQLKARLESSVAAAMSANLITVDPSSDVVEIIDLMVGERINAVPVVDEESNELVGIVSSVDVLGAVRDRLEEEA